MTFKELLYGEVLPVPAVPGKFHVHLSPYSEGVYNDPPETPKESLEEFPIRLQFGDEVRMADYVEPLP